MGMILDCAERGREGPRISDVTDGRGWGVSDGVMNPSVPPRKRSFAAQMRSQCHTLNEAGRGEAGASKTGASPSWSLVTRGFQLGDEASFRLGSEQQGPDSKVVAKANPKIRSRGIWCQKEIHPPNVDHLIDLSL